VYPRTTGCGETFANASTTPSAVLVSRAKRSARAPSYVMSGGGAGGGEGSGSATTGSALAAMDAGADAAGLVGNGAEQPATTASAPPSRCNARGLRPCSWTSVDSAMLRPLRFNAT
jgi:hypothetical protein